MKFRSKAANPKRCAFARCMNSADKIYVDETWKILACSQAHADIAREEIDKVPLEEQEKYFK